MDKMEAVRLALAENGSMSAAELSAFVLARFGVTVEPKLVPVIKATLRDKEMLAASRQSRISA
jgi:hypothetical protein